tara:strand:+ start:3557 stop:3826 length:270 start_codon:yes stop_codon:yes gene_type:complete
MTQQQLKKARFIESDIWQTERDIEDINKILKDYENFGSTIEFKRNKDGYSRSFGSKKNNFKPELEQLLIRLRNQLEKDLIKLKNDFEKI